MSQLFSNNISTTLSSDILSTDTSITLTSGASLNSPVAPDYELITLDNLLGNIEILKITSRVGNTITVVRGQESTTPFGFSASNTKVEGRLTKGTLSLLPKSNSDISLNIGVSSISGNNSSMAIGTSSSALGSNSIALGNLATTSSATASIAVGSSSTSSAVNSISVGYNANNSAATSVLVGDNSTNISVNSVSIGSGVLTGASDTVNIGATNSSYFGINSITIGRLNSGSTVPTNTIIIGKSNVCSFSSSTIVGQSNTPAGTGSVILGNTNKAGASSISIGSNINPVSASSNSIAIGAGALTNAANAISIGSGASSGNASLALGNSANANVASAIAIGANSTATGGTGSLALGNTSSALSTFAISCGDTSTIGTTASYSLALGYGATINNTCANSIAIGSGAICSAPATTVILGTSFMPKIDSVNHTKFFSKITGHLTIIATPIISSSVFNTINSELIPIESMTPYANSLFIIESISFVIVTGTVVTPPTIFIQGSIGGVNMTPGNTTAGSIGQFNLTSVISDGTANLTIRNTTASTGTFTARVLIHGYFVGI